MVQLVCLMSSQTDKMKKLPEGGSWEANGCFLWQIYLPKQKRTDKQRSLCWTFNGWMVWSVGVMNSQTNKKEDKKEEAARKRVVRMPTVASFGKWVSQTKKGTEKKRIVHWTIDGSISWWLDQLMARSVGVRVNQNQKINRKEEEVWLDHWWFDQLDWLVWQALKPTKKGHSQKGGSRDTDGCFLGRFS